MASIEKSTNFTTGINFEKIDFGHSIFLSSITGCRKKIEIIYIFTVMIAITYADLTYICSLSKLKD